MELVLLLVYLLTVYRLTRLVIEDEIADKPRDWVYSKIKPGGMLAYMLSCPWCVSFWLAIPLSIIYIMFPPAMMVIGLPLAGSAIAGLIYQKAG